MPAQALAEVPGGDKSGRTIPKSGDRFSDKIVRKS